MFSHKKILIGVTGGISAYKTCEIVRQLKKLNAEVKVVMTESAMKFIAPLTFSTLTGNNVLLDMFSMNNTTATIHIDAARWADAILICPATGNTISKIANGISDNLLTTIISATTSPVVICPAMNKEMYKKTFLQNNLEKLKSHNFHIVSSDEGELACGEFGVGRLADIQVIIDKLKMILLGSQELAGKRVLITAGRTEEPIDPVRYISNHSSGKMGFALAEIAALMGAEVTLVSGPSNLIPFEGIHYIKITTSQEMADLVDEKFPENDIIIMAAAVSDFRPGFMSNHKLKKKDENRKLELELTKDILKSLGQRKGNKILIGFAIETENEIENAIEKIKNKNLDLIALNNPMQEGAGFKVDTNIVTLIDSKFNIEKLPCMPKLEVARTIFTKIIKHD